ncbi:MAG: patatin-like phospholipase family protein [Acidimicrobiia bacterium]
MTRALVLSGGGPVGIAWQTGLSAGLVSKGVDLSEADFIVGTSAGSAVGARLALGRDMLELTEAYREPSGLLAFERPRVADVVGRMEYIMKTMGETLASVRSPEEQRAAIAKFAVEADTPTEEEFVARFPDLVGAPFPAGYACTAVDLFTGAFRLWDSSSDVRLDRAVASSCCIPGMSPPVTIHGSRYIDGGSRSVTNADVATGHDTVLIVSLSSPAREAANPADPLAARTREQVERERAELLDAGARLEVVGPDEDAAAAIGANLMDAQSAPAAADAGFRQGQAMSATLAGFWS